MKLKVHSFFTTIHDGHMSDRDKRLNFLREQGLSDKLDITMNQVYGDEIIIVDDQYQNNSDCDGLITNRRDAALFVMAADCSTLLFFDPDNKAIGAAHCGRHGTFKFLAQKMVTELHNNFGSNPEDLIVKIGPSISLNCYEVDQEMADFARAEFGDRFVFGRNIDIKSINEYQLVKSGVKPSNIEKSAVCTRCNKNYFSYRRMGHIKHHAGIIALR